MTNEREIILETLMEILEKQQYSHLVIKAVLDKYDYLTKQQRSFIQRVCAGTIEQKIKLDYIIDQFSKTKTKKMKPFIRTLLRMGTYQILFMDAVPDSAVCNESVKLASKRGFSSLKGFVNGVLRAIARQKDSLVFPTRQQDELLYLSISYSMPEWIVRMWLQRFGFEATEQILAGMLERRPLTVRVRECLSEEQIDCLLENWKEAGIEAAQRKELAYAYSISKVDKVSSMPGYEEGLFAIQDMGSMQVVELAAPKDGMAVLDVCAAPGGKSIHAADKMHGTGSVLARDLSEEKTDLIWENIERLGAHTVTAEAFDATIFDESAKERYDVVIADLPCSGLGVIGRKSDIKYRVTMEDVLQIAELQRQILQTIVSYVKVGGTLVFSTCTITEEENEKNRDWMIENLPLELIEEKQLLPGVHNTDGFYMAKFVRK